MKAIHITTDDKIKTVELPDDDDNFNQEASKLVGGYYEIVRNRGLNNKVVMLVDEEGLLKANQKMNMVASIFYGGHRQIMGNVLFLREDFGEEGPQFFSLTPDDEVWVNTLYRMVIKR